MGWIKEKDLQLEKGDKMSDMQMASNQKEKETSGVINHFTRFK